MVDTIKKAGHHFAIIREYPEGTKLLRNCKCRSCSAAIMPFKVLPCGCHGLIVECTCKVHDKQCRMCGAVFIKAQGLVFEVEDPHGANAKL